MLSLIGSVGIDQQCSGLLLFWGDISIWLALIMLLNFKLSFNKRHEGGDQYMIVDNLSSMEKDVSVSEAVLKLLSVE